MTYIHPRIERLRDNPSPNETTRVVVVLAEGVTGACTTEIDAITTATIERTFDESGMLLVDVPEAQLPALCSLDGFDAVAPPDTMRSDI